MENKDFFRKRTEAMSVELPLAVLDCVTVCGKDNAKFSKMEALYDLLDRQRLTVVSGEEWFDCSTLRLAREWKWQRPTVKKFLAKLVNLGVLNLQPSGSRTLGQIRKMKDAQSDNSCVEGDNDTSLKGACASPIVCNRV